MLDKLMCLLAVASFGAGIAILSDYTCKYGGLTTIFTAPITAIEQALAH